MARKTANQRSALDAKRRQMALDFAVSAYTDAHIDTIMGATHRMYEFLCGKPAVAGKPRLVSDNKAANG
jgi:hypothetical protein